MKSYRVIKHIYPDGHENYEVQKRFLGFLWWYNFNNIDGIITGFYDDAVSAVRAIIMHSKNPDVEIIYINL